MHLLVPSDPFSKSEPDDAYAEEVAALRDLGWSVSLFSFEDFEQGDFKARPPLPVGVSVLYRGWMLTAANYERLSREVATRGATLQTTPEQYKLCHHLPGWYEACRDLTVPSVFTSEDGDFESLLAPLRWQRYFVKDFVKSLTTARGSVAQDIAEVREVVGLLRQYRGEVEGGICVREFIELRPDTEERYFVVRGTAYGRGTVVPPIVAEVAARVPSPFFSVDVVERASGELLIIELGDGQVSDRKKWPASRFAAVANAA